MGDFAAAIQPLQHLHIRLPIVQTEAVHVTY